MAISPLAMVFVGVFWPVVIRRACVPLPLTPFIIIIIIAQVKAISSWPSQTIPTRCVVDITPDPITCRGNDP